MIQYTVIIHTHTSKTYHFRCREDSLHFMAATLETCSEVYEFMAKYQGIAYSQFEFDFLPQGMWFKKWVTEWSDK